MNDDVLIEPVIFHDPGCCPKCAGPLTVFDMEMCKMNINSEGQPLDESTTIKCAAVCQFCGETIPMIRWDGGYLPFNETVLVFKMGEIRERAKARIKNDNDGKRDNPLTI